MEKIKLLLVEDNKDLVYMVENSLKITGRYDICSANNGMDGLDLYKSYDPDIIVADISMPYMDGKEMIRTIREIDTKTPVILITSYYKETIDFIDGMSAGANSYIHKPLSIEVLDSQICSLLKLVSHNSLSIIGSEECAIGTFAFCASGKYLSRNGKVTFLTKTETKILDLLIKWKGQLVKREDIIKAIGDSSYIISHQSLNVHVFNLRGKLKKDTTLNIIAITGKGYILKEGFVNKNDL